MNRLLESVFPSGTVGTPRIVEETGSFEGGLSLRIPVSLFLALVLRKAQFSVLTCKLIAVFARFAKAVEVAFL